MVVMECITCLHQSLTSCVCAIFGAIQCGHHFALVLWLLCLLFITPMCFTHAHHIWTVDVVEWYPRGFTQSISFPLHLVVGIKVLTNDGFHFTVVWRVTNAHTGSTHRPSPKCPPTPHNIPHGLLFKVKERCDLAA